MGRVHATSASAEAGPGLLIAEWFGARGCRVASISRNQDTLDR